MGEAKRRKLNGFVTEHRQIPSERDINRLAAHYANIYGNKSGDESTRIAFATEVRSFIKLAFEYDGWNAFKSTRELAAAHEAGHIVVLGLYGRRTKSCLVRSSDISDDNYTDWGGLTVQHDNFWIVSSTTSPENDWKQAANTIAGWIGENVHDGIFRPGSSIDELANYKLICAAIHDKLNCPFETLMRNGMELVQRHIEEYKPIHSALTTMLIQETQLGEETIDSIMAPNYNDVMPDYAKDFIALIRVVPTPVEEVALPHC